MREQSKSKSQHIRNIPFQKLYMRSQHPHHAHLKKSIKKIECLWKNRKSMDMTLIGEIGHWYDMHDPLHHMLHEF